MGVILGGMYVELKLTAYVSCIVLKYSLTQLIGKHHSKTWQLNSNFIDKNNDTAQIFNTGTIARIIAVAPDSLETYSDKEYQLLTLVHKQLREAQYCLITISMYLLLHSCAFSAEKARHSHCKRIFVILAIALSSELQPMDMDSCAATTILLLQY